MNVDRVSLVSSLFLLTTMLSGCQMGQRDDGRNGFDPQGVAIHDGASLYTVRAGDTFYSVARRHDTSVEVLMQLNPHVTPTALRVGSELRIPGGKTPVRAIQRKNPR